MNNKQIHDIILAHGGRIQGGINWTWALFLHDDEGRKAFALIEPHVDHRGYYEAQPDSANPNLHLGGFRYR